MTPLLVVQVASESDLTRLDAFVNTDHHHASGVPMALLLDALEIVTAVHVTANPAVRPRIITDQSHRGAPILSRSPKSFFHSRIWRINSGSLMSCTRHYEITYVGYQVLLQSSNLLRRCMQLGWSLVMQSCRHPVVRCLKFVPLCWTLSFLPIAVFLEDASFSRFCYLVVLSRSLLFQQV